MIDLANNTMVPNRRSNLSTPSIIVIVLEVLPPRLAPRAHRLRRHAKGRYKVELHPAPIARYRSRHAAAMALVAAARSEQPGCSEAHAAAVEEHAEDSEEGHEERAAEAETEVAGGGAV